MRFLVGRVAAPAAVVMVVTASLAGVTGAASPAHATPDAVEPAIPGDAVDEGDAIDTDQIDTDQIDAEEIAATVVYRLDPENRRIVGTARVTVRNRDRHAGRELGTVSLALPAVDPSTVRASRSGVAVPVAAGPADDDFAVFTFGLGRPIGPGELAELSITFTIRATVSLREPAATRIDPAYVSFPARGLGDPGLSSVSVEWPVFFPGRWADVDAATEERGFVASSTVYGVGSDFVEVFEMRNDARLERTRLAIPETTAGAELATWESDIFWRFRIGADLTVLIPALVELVGEPWPLTAPLVVRETNAGVAHGYGGSFVRTADGGGEIEMGTVLDRRVLAHELAHAWFDERFDPWMAEGLAEEYAHQATGLVGFDAVVRDDDSARDDGVLPLETWVPRTDRAAEADAYAAAASVFRALAADLGAEGLRAVVRSLLAEESPYGTDLPRVEGLRDWQRLLDGAEQAGSTTVASLLTTWVLAAPPVDLLDQRAVARAALVSFTERAGTWGVPRAIRIAMSRWDFATALEAIEAAELLLDERDRIATASAALGVAPPVEPAERFASDPRAATEALIEQAVGLDAVERAAAVAGADRSWVERVGLWGDDLGRRRGEVESLFEAGEHDAAARAADALERVADDAGSLGARRIAGVVAVVAAVALVALLIGVGRVRRRAAAG